MIDLSWPYPVKVKTPHHRARDITGVRSGKLEAVRYYGSDGVKSVWIVRCGCGRRFLMCPSELQKGKQKSCGCDWREGIGRSNTKHGMTHHPLYAVWRSMIARCTNPDHPAWKNYGGRGITVCDRWMRFEFFVRDMAVTYERGLDLDRRDNNRGYERRNCRWTTRKVNCNNRRNSVLIDGEPLVDAAVRLGVPLSTMRYRHDRDTGGRA